MEELDEFGDELEFELDILEGEVDLGKIDCQDVRNVASHQLLLLLQSFYGGGAGAAASPLRFFLFL